MAQRKSAKTTSPKSTKTKVKVTAKKTASKETTKKTEPKDGHPFGDVTETEYRGNAILNIPLVEGGRYSLSFGLSKAKAIIEYYSEIQAFVKKHS